MGGVYCFRFQNEYNKVEIARRDVRFWSKIKLVITQNYHTLQKMMCKFHTKF